MTTNQSARAAELAQRFADSRQRGDVATRLVNYEAKTRRAIIAEMLTFMSHSEAARVLGLDRSRISQLAGKVEIIPGTS